MTPPERDAAILEHLRRYHLTTPEILHRLFFPGVGLNAVRKVTARLIREGRIWTAPLFEQRKYFVLTFREAERLGEHRSIGGNFEYPGLVNAYGLLCFCVENGIQKFTVKEFAEYFSDFVIPGVRSGNYYLETEKTEEGLKELLGFIHVDYGVSIFSLMKKIQKIIRRPYTMPIFAKLIHERSFVLTILTPTEEKAEEIRAALVAEETGRIRFRVEVVPELNELFIRRGRIKSRDRDRRERRRKKSDQTKSVETTPASMPPAGDVSPPITEATA